MTPSREKLDSWEEVRGPIRFPYCMSKAGPSLPGIQWAEQGRAGQQQQSFISVKTPGQEFSVLTALWHHMGVLFNVHIWIPHWSTGDLASNDSF